MKILLTSAASTLGRQIAVELGERHEIRMTDRSYSSLPSDGYFSGQEHDASTNLLVRGLDALVVAGEAFEGENAASYLDAMTRKLYNLLMAAYQEGVQRVVYLSTLELMKAYGPEYIVTERWRPRPTTEPHLLGKYLGEFVCREFAREHKLKVVVLRLGKVTSASEVMGESVDPMWLDQSDMGSAIEGALTADLPMWSVIHVQGKQSGAQYPVGDAERLIGYVPEIDFSVPSHMN